MNLNQSLNESIKSKLKYSFESNHSVNLNQSLNESIKSKFKSSFESIYHDHFKSIDTNICNTLVSNSEYIKKLESELLE